jgi:hypothetical protein
MGSLGRCPNLLDGIVAGHGCVPDAGVVRRYRVRRVRGGERGGAAGAPESSAGVVAADDQRSTGTKRRRLIVLRRPPRSVRAPGGPRLLLALDADQGLAALGDTDWERAPDRCGPVLCEALPAPVDSGRQLGRGSILPADGAGRFAPLVAVAPIDAAPIAGECDSFTNSTGWAARRRTIRGKTSAPKLPS